MELSETSQLDQVEYMLRLNIVDSVIIDTEEVLSEDQISSLREFNDLSLLGSLTECIIETDNPYKIIDTQLKIALSKDIRTAPYAQSVNMESLVETTSGDVLTLMYIGILNTMKKISDYIEVIQSCKNRTTPRIKGAGKILSYLRPDIAEERGRAIRAALEEHRTLAASNDLRRDQAFTQLHRTLLDIQQDPAQIIVSNIPKWALLEAANINNDKHGQPINRAYDVPGRVERLASYITSKPFEASDISTGVELSSEESDTGEAIARKAVIKKRLKIPGFDNTFDEISAIRYADKIEVDVIRHLKPGPEEVAHKIDRNPINQQGLDKFEAIIDQLARYLAAGIMPWQSTTIKSIRKSGKIRPEYNQGLFYTYDVSPNAPRVYFILGDPYIGETRSQHRDVFIIAETDKANQLDTYKQLFINPNRKHLRKAKVGQI